MIALELPLPLVWALRWALFLGPLSGSLFFGWRARCDDRALVGALFAFLYGAALIFAMHMLALQLGWWSYGGDVLMVQGLPADIWIGGALLFGPVLYLAFPAIAPLWIVLPIVVGLHGTVFSSLSPLVTAGGNWAFGVIVVFAVAHVPALYLARWTARDEHLAWRAALLAFGYGFAAFMVLPSLILHCTGGRWDLDGRPAWLVAVCAAAGVPLIVMGLSAAQTFAIHGEGTPIPLDPTRRLVRTGLFAYLTNPMQLCTAATWIVMGVAIGSVWVASAAVMAWVFVAGMVRWHQRHDLLQRFPVGWPIYRAHVHEWLPRWRPWIPTPATLTVDPGSNRHARFVAFLRHHHPVGLDLRSAAGAGLGYVEPDEIRSFTGIAAVAKALNHIHFGWALISAVTLLVVLPLGALKQAAPRRALVARS